MQIYLLLRLASVLAPWRSRTPAVRNSVRAEMLPQGASEYLDLELYLAWRSDDLPIETAGVRR